MHISINITAKEMKNKEKADNLITEVISLYIKGGNFSMDEITDKVFNKVFKSFELMQKGSDGKKVYSRTLHPWMESAIRHLHENKQ